MSMADDIEYAPDFDERLPSVEDKYWKDGKGKLHHIPHMKIEHVEACIRLLFNRGYKPEEIPKAFFKRYKQRHEIITNDFEDLK